MLTLHILNECMSYFIEVVSSEICTLCVACIKIAGERKFAFDKRSFVGETEIVCNFYPIVCNIGPT